MYPATSPFSDFDDEPPTKPQKSSIRELRGLQADIAASSQDFRVQAKRSRKPVNRLAKLAVAEPQHLPTVKSGSAGRSGGETGLTGQDYCKQIHGKLMGDAGCSWAFHHPVDVEGLKLKDYREIVKNPMDLGTIRTKLDSNAYNAVVDFAADVRLMFSNCYLYNGPKNRVHKDAKKLNVIFERCLKQIPAVYTSSSGMYTYFRTCPGGVVESVGDGKEPSRKRRHEEVDVAPDSRTGKLQSLEFLKTQFESVKAQLSKLIEMEDMGQSSDFGQRKKVQKTSKVKKMPPAESPSSHQPSSTASTSSLVPMKRTSPRQGMVNMFTGYVSDDEDEVLLTKDDIRELSLRVSCLPDDGVIEVYLIVTSNENLASDPESDEITLDLETFSQSTLREIQAFLKKREQPARKAPVSRALGAGVRRSAKVASASSKRTGGCFGSTESDSANGYFSVSSSSSDSDSDSSDED